MNFRSHVSGGTNDLLNRFIGGGKAKVTQFKVAFGWNQDILKFDIHVGITDLVVKTIECIYQLNIELSQQPNIVIEETLGKWSYRGVIVCKTPHEII